MSQNHTEVEVRFLNINKEKTIQKLHTMGAKDCGEQFLQEMIFYDQAGEWKKHHQKMVRIRSSKEKIFLSYKQFDHNTPDGTKEITIEVNDLEKTQAFLEAVCLKLLRSQEKKRHTFQLDTLTFDIDTWPSMPPLLEIEGSCEEQLKDITRQLGLSWNDAIFENQKIVQEKYYNIPVAKLKYFTFEKIEEHYDT